MIPSESNGGVRKEKVGGNKREVVLPCGSPALLCFRGREGGRRVRVSVSQYSFAALKELASRGDQSGFRKL